MTSRRAFITLVGGAAAWPLAASAQQPGRMRRIVLMAFNETDSRANGWLSRFAKGLSELGWTNGSNLRIDSHSDLWRLRNDILRI